MKSAQTIREFLDRNVDFRDLYKSAEQTFEFCGFYDINDVLGKSCPYSDSSTCSGVTDAFIPMIIRFIGDLMASLAKCVVWYLVLEIIIFIFIIPTLKSSPEPQEKKVQMMSLSPDTNSQTVPLVVGNASTQNPVVVPVQSNPQSVYVTKPISEGVFPAIPVTGHISAQ